MRDRKRSPGGDRYDLVEYQVRQYVRPSNGWGAGKTVVHGIFTDAQAAQQCAKLVPRSPTDLPPTVNKVWLHKGRIKFIALVNDEEVRVEGRCNRVTAYENAGEVQV